MALPSAMDNSDKRIILTLTRSLPHFFCLILVNMDSLPKYDNLPWDMILSALQGTLLPEEDLQFREWLALSPDNQHQYDQLEQIWKDKLADYTHYREADEEKAWTALQRTLGEKVADKPPVGKVAVTPPIAKVADHPPVSKVVQMTRRWAAVAAIFLLTVGAGWWYLSQKNAPLSYETALGQKKISLPDGSTIVLDPGSLVRVARDYNKGVRTVILAAGEAHFDVAHQAQQPFLVDMDVVSVRDIGTSFFIQKTKDSIKVTVTDGRIAFSRKETGESRELSAGSSLIYYSKEHRFGNITDTSPANQGAASLRFDNVPLSQVIATLQNVFGKKISLNDSTLAQKKLTVHLDGESFDNAIKIVCASLNLKYVEKNDVYTLK